MSSNTPTEGIGRGVRCPTQSLSPLRPSLNERRESDLPPHERHSVTRVPVTPGVALGTYDLSSIGDDPGRKALNLGYFSSNEPGSDSSPAHSAEEDLAPAEPQANHVRFRLAQAPNARNDSSLELSGAIISAVFTIPQSLKYRRDNSWELSYPLHNSALLDSLSHLSSEETQWSHTVIGWTGEISQLQDDVLFSDASTRSSPASPSRSWNQTLSKHMAYSTPHEPFIPDVSRLQLEKQLYDDKIKTVPVWLTETENTIARGDGYWLKHQSRWRQYAEHDLCSLFHYRQHPPTGGRQEDTRWADFYRMNEQFADKVCKVYKPGDIVMIHDYHLMLLPAMLRQRRPDIYISFFLYTPFPTSELFRCLRRRREVLKGVLGASLIAFQTSHYAQHFTSCCTRVLNLPASTGWVEIPGARVHIGVFPVGIHVSKVTSLAFMNVVDEKCAELRKLHENKKVIIGYDSLDRLGGMDKKLLAFQHFLDRYPEWRGKVVLLQITSPATMEDDNGEESRYKARVNELISAINSAYGSLEYMPIECHTEHLSQEDYFALLRAGDAALITSVRDGMNTTGLEYVACQRATHGPLIISEFSGTASVLEGATRINPWDTTAVSDEINRALAMSYGQRKALHEAMYKRVTQGDMIVWVNSILDRLAHVMSP